MHNIKLDETYKKPDFNLRLHIDQALSEHIKVDNVLATTPFLEQLKQSLTFRKEKCEDILNKLSTAKSNLKLEKKIQVRQAQKNLQGLIEEQLDLYQELNNKEDKVSIDMKNVLNVKKKVDKLNEEKESIMAEIFILDMVKDMKLNNGNTSRVETLQQKMIFSKNIRNIENHINLYEKQLLESFYDIKKKVEAEFIEILKNEIEFMKFEYTKQFIDYFFEVNEEKRVFEIIAHNFILALNFSKLSTSFTKETTENFTIMLQNFVGLVQVFYEKSFLVTEHIIKFFSEERFFKLTSYIFDTYLQAYLDATLGQNLVTKNDQFFLEYLEKINEIFTEFNPKFQEFKKYSIYFHELIITCRSTLLEKYFEEYFNVEHRFFQYRHKIYIDIIKDKLETAATLVINKGKLEFNPILEVLNSEKLEEYISFIKQSINRCNNLSKSSFNYYQINKLIIYSLQEFQTFCAYIIMKISDFIDKENAETTYIDPIIYKVIEFLNILLVRMNINQKSYIGLIKASNYYSETDEFRMAVIKSIKSSLKVLTKNYTDKIFINLNNIYSSKKQKKGQESIIERFQELVAPYIYELKNVTNAETKQDLEETFYGRYLQILEDKFLNLDSKRRSRLNFVEEFKYFFEAFNDVKQKELIADVTAFKYLLLCFKSGDLNISKFLSDTTGEHINVAKIEKYKNQLEYK